MRKEGEVRWWGLHERTREIKERRSKEEKEKT